jgi:single-strand DNA-binding protein
VAVSGRVRDGERWRYGEPAFYSVVVWRDQAEHAAESLSKGSRVVVVGRLQQRSWQADDGTTRSVVEVVADELGPSLRWGDRDDDQGDAELEPVTTGRPSGPPSPAGSTNAHP